MLTIWRDAHFFIRPYQLASAYSIHLAFRSFSSTGYKAGPPRTPQETKEIKSAKLRLYRAKNADIFREKNRSYYKANRAAILLRHKEYRLRVRPLETKFEGRSQHQMRIERKAEHERRRAEVLAESERRCAADQAEKDRWRAEKKAENETWRAKEKAAREQRRAERSAERQRYLAQEKAMLAQERATRQATRRAASAERKGSLAQEKAMLAQERATRRATGRATKVEENRELARQKAAEYRRDPDFRKNTVAQEQQRRAADLNYARRQDMRVWLLRCSQPRAFSWKTHVPIIYPRRVVKTCSACGKARAAGAALWWKSLLHTDTDVFECHTCYATDCSRAMPRGFEDFQFGNGKNPKP
jgi:hypothetical protein